MMLVEFGHFALWLVLALCMLALLPVLRPSLLQQAPWQKLLQRSAYGALALTALSFGALTYAYITSDFSVLNVVQNSHSAKPLLYKITGVWGNHEGSLLLWLLVLLVCAALAARCALGLPPAAQARAITVMLVIAAGFAALILFTSNPFARVLVPPLDGQDLNPLLQDPGLAFHPPLLYVGYVGTSLVFAVAVAALWQGEFTATWARVMRVWALFAWAFLTAGLALGSWWAYYELGWGGWWFWDPVENAALLPWLTCTALIHAVRVVEQRGSMLRWVLLLAIISFACALLGTFLVRSGVLNSVHAFASDPLRGMAILALVIFYVGGAFALYAWRLPKLPAENLFQPISREGALLLNNLLLVVAAGVVLLGTIYPLLLDAVGLPPITVGPPFFNATFIPLIAPLLVALPFGIFMPWRAALLQRLRPVAWPLAAALLISLVGYYYFIGYKGAWALVGAALGVWVLAGSVVDLRRHWHAPQKILHLPRWLGHAGLGLMILGMAGTALDAEYVERISIGQRFSYAGYEFVLQGVAPTSGANYTATTASIEMRRDGQLITTLQPEKRFYPVAEITTTEAAIYTKPLYDIFIMLGDQIGARDYSFKLRYHPLQPVLWLGAALLVLAGVIGMTNAARQPKKGKS